LKIKQILKEKYNKLKLSPGFKKYFANMGWLFFERVIKILVAFFVGVYVARYLGPSDYGLLSYSESFVGLFLAIATLGLDNIVVRELVKDTKKKDELLGTAFALKIIGAFLVFGVIAIAVRLTDNDNFTNLLIFIIAAGTIFQSFNVINFYFQSIVLSKYVVYSQTFATISGAIANLFLIYFNMHLVYFVLVILIQNIILAIGLILIYKRQKLIIFNWKLQVSLAIRLLKDSWPLIFSGIAIAIYMKIDQVMIKVMLSTEAVGVYAVAVKLSEVWYFIPMVICNSVFPAIINSKKIGEELYYGRLQKLYNLMTWLAIGIAIPITFLSNDIVRILFGTQYRAAATVLKIHIWAGVFVFLGVASTKYLISENYTKLSLLKTLAGAIVNVILNLILIPRYNINGAAIATVISQFVACFLITVFPKTRKNSILMLKSIFLVEGIKKLVGKVGSN
jgi:O-antigen/teichoic acid export membrane protein